MSPDPLSADEKSRVRLADVARHAGVGVMTASRALSQPEAVSDRLRGRVMAAVEALGYRRNPAAAALSSGRSRAIPVIVPTLAHPVYVAFLRGVTEVLAAAGMPYDVIVATSEYDPDAEHARISGLLDWHPAGIMVAGVEHTDATRLLLTKARAAGVAVVEFMDLTDTPIDINIGFSHQKVGHSVAEWLHARGHRNVACISGMASLDLRARKRSAAFAETMEVLGGVAHVITMDEPSSMTLGAQALARLMDEGTPVSAVFCANDEMAAGVLFEARRRGLSVPADLSVIGFNDTEIAAMLDPAVTSIRTDRLAMGQQAATLMLGRIASGESAPLSVDMGFALVERTSTCPSP
jgi:LacI family gluconate utilization system Gnt-I transcriptional repressor